MFDIFGSKEELNREVIEVTKNIDILNTKMKNLEAELKLQKEENAKLWRIHKYAKDGEVTHTFKLETESCGMFIRLTPVITLYNDGRELEPIKLQELSVHHMDNIKHESRTFFVQ